MSGFPGLETSIDGSAVFDPTSCSDTVSGLSALGATDLTVLVEREELDVEGFEILERVASNHSIGVQYNPIVDYGIPDAAFLTTWHDGIDRRRAVFEAGGTFAVACQYGAGRSGTIASLCLIEQGVIPHAAVQRVRSFFPEAVESKAQMEWLQGLV